MLKNSENERAAKMKKTTEAPVVTDLHFIQQEHDAFNQYLELTKRIVDLAEKMSDPNTNNDVRDIYLDQMQSLKESQQMMKDCMGYLKGKYEKK